MSIPETLKKINPTAHFSGFKENFRLSEDIFIVIVIILIGLAGFGLGKLSALEKNREPVIIKPLNLENCLKN